MQITPNEEVKKHKIDPLNKRAKILYFESSDALRYFKTIFSVHPDQVYCQY